MTTTSILAVPGPRVGSGPARPGLNPAQQRALARLEAARAVIADLPPLDPDYIHAERRWETWRRWNGQDS